MNYLILGASAAGINAAKEIRKLSSDADITIAATDKHVYSRCILHHYIEGIRNIEQMSFAGPDVISENNINFLTEHTVKSIDHENKQVHFENGHVQGYDKLLIATGSSSFIPPVPGLREGRQVIGLRNLSDAEYIRDTAKKGMNVCVVGSGLVGIDALEALVSIGCNVHLVDMGAHILPLQLDQYSADVILDEFKANHFVSDHFNTLVSEIKLDADNNVVGAKLQNGEEFDCELVVVAAGTRSNINFLEGSGIATSQCGLEFDENGQTNVADVYGAGDVSGKHPIWPMAVKEGIIAAHNMVGEEMVMDDFFALKATMNFCNIPSMSLGNHTPKEDGFEIIIEKDDKNYKKVVLKDGNVVGCILQGDISYSGIITQLIKRELDVSMFDKPVFKISFADFFAMDEKVDYTFE